VQAGLSLIFEKKPSKEGRESEIAQQGSFHVFDFSQNWERGDRWLIRLKVREGKQGGFAADLS
jgi:hypothetical protein